MRGGELVGTTKPFSIARISLRTSLMRMPLTSTRSRSFPFSEAESRIRSTAPPPSSSSSSVIIISPPEDDVTTAGEAPARPRPKPPPQPPLPPAVTPQPLAADDRVERLEASESFRPCEEDA